MHERSLVSVKVEPRFSFKLSTFYLASTLFTRLKINVLSQKRVSGNQPSDIFSKGNQSSGSKNDSCFFRRIPGRLKSNISVVWLP